MTLNSAKNADVRKEHSVPNKTDPTAAEHSSANKTDMTTKFNKNDKTTGEKKDQRKEWDKHHDKLANTTPEKIFANDPHINKSTTLRLRDFANRYKRRFPPP
ncbi:hypothetical protein FMEXI_8242 [Fusarium mexicanum]|uniref:Uncharacterized protein n=1 Tax=Fusarium mexicanum TaxID=751941 RepID=A0A8H5IQ48_9HYPO|nr:hypothetical protein FMEXI_8242 [Fusarium mexicanum]